MSLIGFSTGALQLGDFARALRLLEGTSSTALELSALRLPELPVLIDAMPRMDLEQFTYVSIHAPSRFAPAEEDGVIELLKQVPSERPIIVHPDTIHSPDKWIRFGSQLTLENMDRRKADGRTAKELSRWFESLPDAKLCFDLAHAHQCDRTMTEAFRILRKLGERIRQLHISELDSTGHHFPLSFGSIRAFSEVASRIPADAPAIIESLNPLRHADDEVQRAWMEEEAQRATEAIGRELAPPHTPFSQERCEGSSAPIPA
jgi:sugar phosphate isomerase/epimerase